MGGLGAWGVGCGMRAARLAPSSHVMYVVYMMRPGAGMQHPPTLPNAIRTHKAPPRKPAGEPMSPSGSAVPMRTGERDET